MIIAVTILAGLGLFFLILGRWLILKESSDMSASWRFALRVLPLAELFFCAVSWEKAKAGSAMCLIGLALLSPMAGQVVSDFVQPEVNVGSAVKFKDQLVSLWKTDGRTSRLNRERVERENLARHKEIKVRELSDHLVTWYASLEERRAAFIAEGGGDVSEFDKEAACYHALLAAAKEESAELDLLQARPVLTAAAPSYPATGISP